MKAILVIDIDDSLVEGEERFAVDGYLMQESDCVGCYEAVGRINAVLKPLPDCPDVPDTIANDVAYIIGWNDCIVEISKERKEAKSLIKNEKESVSNANGTSIK